MIHKISRTLEIMQGFFLASALFISVPYFGGNNTYALYFIRCVILLAAFLRVLRYALPIPIPPDKIWPTIRFPLASFSVFLLYVSAQWWGGTSGFTQRFLGSAYPYQTTEECLQLFFYGLFFILCIDFFSSRKKLRYFLFVFAVELTLLVAWVNYLKINKLIPSIHGDLSPWIFFVGNSNHYGAILAMVIPLLLGWVASNIKIARDENRFTVSDVENVFYLALTSLLVVSIFYARARAVFIAEIVFLVVFLFISMGAGRSVKLVYFIVMFGFIFLLLNFVGASDITLSEYQTLPEALFRRLQFSRESVAIVLAHPFFGTGLGTFAWVNRGYQITQVESFFFKTCYNSYLQVFIETGLVGAGLFFTMLLSLLAKAVRRFKDTEFITARAIGSASGLALIMLAFLSFADGYLRTPAIAMLAILHLCLVLRTPTMVADAGMLLDTDSLKSGTQWIRSKRIYIVIAILFLAFSFFTSTRNFQARVLLDKNGSIMYGGLTNKRNQLSEKLLKKSIELRSDCGEAWAFLGRYFFLQKDYQKSAEAYQQSTSLLPSWPDTWFHLGGAKYRLGQKKGALEAMERGIYFIPHNRDAYLMLICYYLLAADQADDPKEKREYLDGARAWIEKTQKLRRPLSLDDFDYIYEYDHRNAKPRKLRQAEKARLMPLLKED